MLQLMLLITLTCFAWMSAAWGAAGGFGAELVADLAKRCFLHLEAPPVRVSAWLQLQRFA